ncbi:TetR family transcriptional regulator [Streptomyces sp. NPDC006385]|uniref:TetR/AcrR family transcriptional regulator n=1 Tax=Streptomyces sp. NPDC006385 TaxID=3156761 RepID=UPI0033AD61BC
MSSPARPSAAALSLTERRKAATRMEIARAAAGLFVKQGLRATRAEDIAQAAGVAPRTFYRYFATKEEAVAPLYAAGADRWSEAVRTAPSHLTVPQALEHAIHHTLTPGAAVSAASWEWVRTLVNLANSSPALRKVWAEVCREAEATLAVVLAERVTGTGDDNVAEPARPSSPAPSPAPSPALRFAAAVAAATVRVAVETWADGTAPAQGPQGPAALAMRNLEALRDFPWQNLTDPPA